MMKRPEIIHAVRPSNGTGAVFLNVCNGRANGHHVDISMQFLGMKSHFRCTKKDTCKSHKQVTCPKCLKALKRKAK
jgi:hypothetical protein